MERSQKHGRHRSDFTVTSHLLHNERMPERLVEGQAFAGVEHQDLLQEIAELSHFAHLPIFEPHPAEELRQQVASDLDVPDHGRLVLQRVTHRLVEQLSQRA